MTNDVDEAVARIEALLDGFREREKAEELVQALMEVYGAGLERILAIVRDSGEAVLERMADDKLVASLLLIHGLHPIDAETRIRRALERIGKRLPQPDALELVTVTGGVARVKVNNGAAPLAELVERALRDAAPEVEHVEIEGAARAGGLVQIT